jgi:hypothetical protein
MTHFYANIIIDSIDRLERFKTRVTRPIATSSKWGTNCGGLVGHLVVHLRITDDIDDDVTQVLSGLDDTAARYASHLTSWISVIVDHLPNLKNFQNEISVQWLSHLSYLIVLRHVCSRTLTHLSISISREEDGVFQAVNSLSQLQYMNVLILSPWDVSNEIWLHNLQHPLVLPLVREMVWRTEGMVTQEIICFIAACRAGPGCDFVIAMPELEPQPATLLADFITQNAVESLTMDFITLDVQDVIAPLLALIPKLYIYNSAAAAALGLQASLPSLLTLDSCLDGDEDDQKQFWAFMHTLQNRAAPLARPCVIKIYCGESLFSWTKSSGYQHHATFIGRLLPIAIKLLKHHILVTDVSDVDCGHFTQSIHAR